MFLPLRTDRRLQHTPWVNMTLVTVNVMVFFVQKATEETGRIDWSAYYLHAHAPSWYQYFTYQFLHAGTLHLVGNMLFLYVFGNGVEDRLRPVGYLIFYLLGGAAAGAGHALFHNSSLLGASGSVAAVTGAFMVLMPKTIVTVLALFVFLEVPSLLVIPFFYIYSDIFMPMVMLRDDGVAHLAHLAGSLFGFVVGMMLLIVRVLPREPYDLPALIRHWNRRRQFRALANRGYQPWEGKLPGKAGGGEPSPEERRIMERRAQISGSIEAGEYARAVDGYAELLEMDHDQVMPAAAQQDVGNHAMEQGRHELAARAYELYLETYGTQAAAAEIRLLLCLLYIRYLGRPDAARPLLAELDGKLDDPSRQALAQALTDEIGSA